MLQMSKTRCLILLCLVLMLAPIAKNESERHDGNWWRSLSVSTRYIYTMGFMDGTDLGFNFSYWKFAHTDPKCLVAVQDSYKEHMTKYLLNVTNDQLADGLTKVYEDYRNRRINVNDTTWLVLNEIAGTPKDVDNWRKNAQ